MTHAAIRETRSGASGQVGLPRPLCGRAHWLLSEHLCVRELGFIVSNWEVLLMNVSCYSEITHLFARNCCVSLEHESFHWTNIFKRKDFLQRREPCQRYKYARTHTRTHAHTLRRQADTILSMEKRTPVNVRTLDSAPCMWMYVFICTYWWKNVSTSRLCSNGWHWRLQT